MRNLPKIPDIDGGDVTECQRINKKLQRASSLIGQDRQMTLVNCRSAGLPPPLVSAKQSESSCRSKTSPPTSLSLTMTSSKASYKAGVLTSQALALAKATNTNFVNRSTKLYQEQKVTESMTSSASSKPEIQDGGSTVAKIYSAQMALVGKQTSIPIQSQTGPIRNPFVPLPVNSNADLKQDVTKHIAASGNLLQKGAVCLDRHDQVFLTGGGNSTSKRNSSVPLETPVGFPNLGKIKTDSNISVTGLANQQAVEAYMSLLKMQLANQNWLSSAGTRGQQQQQAEIEPGEIVKNRSFLRQFSPPSIGQSDYDFSRSKTETFQREINSLASQIIQKSSENLTVFPTNEKKLGQPPYLEDDTDMLRGTKRRKQSCPIKSVDLPSLQGQSSTM